MFPLETSPVTPDNSRHENSLVACSTDKPSIPTQYRFTRKFTDHWKLELSPYLPDFPNQTTWRWQKLDKKHLSVQCWNALSALPSKTNWQHLSQETVNLTQMNIYQPQNQLNLQAKSLFNLEGTIFATCYKLTTRPTKPALKPYGNCTV